MWAKSMVSVTLLPMLVHSIIGCCWHHAHVDGDLACQHENAESQVCHGHKHAHEHMVGTDSNAPVVPTPCEHEDGCDEVRCVYVATESLRITMAFEFNAHAVAFDVPCDIVVMSPIVSMSNLNQPPRVVVALQQCALTQVWIV